MSETLKRLASPEYLVVADPGPMGGLWVLYLLLGILFLSGLAAALWILSSSSRAVRPTPQRAWAWFQLWISTAGLATVAGRFLSWPGWSARIWPYSLALLSLLGTIAYLLRRVRLTALLSHQLSILALHPPETSLSSIKWEARPSRMRLAGGAALLLMHLAGTAFLVRVRWGGPLWSAPLLLAILLSPQLAIRDSARRIYTGLLALAPLFATYIAALLWALYEYLDMTIIGWQGLAFPDPMTSLFYLDGLILAAFTLTILCQLRLVSSQSEKSDRFWRWITSGLLAAVLIWASIVYLGKRTHGATASDPYAYAQMAVDLAERGTFLHRFPLFAEVAHLDIAWAPLQPVGYHLPINPLGDSASVWATGASAFLALGYWLLGEPGLYVTTPLIALLALGATWALIAEALRGADPPLRHATAALAVALTATSPEHVDRLLVPMGDAPAQLFTVLALLFLLRGMRRLREGHTPIVVFALSGLALGAAYWVRHTQLVLIFPALAVMALGWKARQRPGQPNPSPERTDNDRRAVTLVLIAFCAAALAAAIPDTVYRWRTFGGPFATETTELPLMSLRHLVPVLEKMLREALVAGEWGYLFPLALYGAYRFAHDRKQESLVLGSAFALILLVHLTYSALRLRDLISLFPLANLAVAYGALTLARRARAAVRPHSHYLGDRLLPAAAVTWLILSLALSRWAMIDNLWKPGWASFGYMNPQQRAAFDRLAALTPSDSVIAASLNAGAVTLHSERDAVRPYDGWTLQDWKVFLATLHAAGRPVFLLDDGTRMAEFIETHVDQVQLVPIDELSIPVFFTRDRQTGWLYRLELNE